MKRMYQFNEQVNALSCWFKEWNDCEQTVALYSLLKKVDLSQAKFLALVLEQSLSGTKEHGVFIQLEEEANSAEYISHLHCDETALAPLLSHLPLLQSGSTQAKKAYLSLIPQIFQWSVNKGCHFDESRQLLSYLLIHPALTKQERDSLMCWLVKLEERNQTQKTQQFSPGNSTPPSPSPTPIQQSRLSPPDINHGLLGSKLNGWRSHCSSRDSGIADTSGAVTPMGPSGGQSHFPLESTVSAPPAVNIKPPSNDYIDGNTAGLSLPYRGRRSLPITPSSSSSHSPLPNPSSFDWPSQEDVDPQRPHPSLFPPSDHAPLSPTSSGSSTETHNEENHQPLQKKNSFIEENSGMKDVPSWLKSLRLHKYTSLFQQLSYEEMMKLTEEKLEAMAITKGARHKIVVNVTKLKERQQTLRSLEKDIEDGNPRNIRNALNEVRAMLASPMKRYESQTGRKDSDTEQGSPIPEGDLPGQMTRFMGKMCTQLLVSRRPDEEHINMYIQLLTQCLMHEAFTDTQKKRLSSWQQSCQKFTCSPLPRKLSLDYKQANRGGGYFGSGTFPNEYTLSRSASTGRQPLSRKPAFAGNQQARPAPTLLTIGPVTAPGPGSVFRPTQSGNIYIQPRQLGGSNNHTLVSRTKSVPIRRGSQPSSSPFISPQHAPLTRVETPLHIMGEPEINNRLEDLCVSMTEHALADGPEQEGNP